MIGSDKGKVSIQQVNDLLKPFLTGPSVLAYRSECRGRLRERCLFEWERERAASSLARQRVGTLLPQGRYPHLLTKELATSATGEIPAVVQQKSRLLLSVAD